MFNLRESACQRASHQSKGKLVLLYFQSEKGFYVFTANAGGNENNTKYDASCRADRRYDHWTCDPKDDTLKSCFEYWKCKDDKNECLYDGNDGTGCNAPLRCEQMDKKKSGCTGEVEEDYNEDCKCTKKEIGADTFGWVCPKGNVVDDCPNELKVCGRTGAPTQEFTTTPYGACPDPCKCLDWTCPNGGYNCDPEDKICKGGCKYCENNNEVCPPHMVDDEPSDLKPAWNLIR